MEKGSSANPMVHAIAIGLDTRVGFPERTNAVRGFLIIILSIEQQYYNYLAPDKCFYKSNVHACFKTEELCHHVFGVKSTT